MAGRKGAAQRALRRWTVYPLQALAAYLWFGIVSLLPLDAASGLGGWLGRTIGPRLGITRRARRNLNRAFPEKPTAEIDVIIQGMWENLGRTLFEYPHLDDLGFYQEDSRVEILGTEHIDALRDDGKPGIFFSGHLANWEIMARTIAHRGLPIHAIYRAPNNPLVDRLFRHRRPGAGELLAKGSEGARRVLTLLRENGHLGMLVDQKMNDGIPVPFFGHDAMTAPALAQFAIRFDCPVIPIRVERLGGAHFRVTHNPPMVLAASGDRHADIAAIMHAVNAQLEAWIRERPEQWLWLHRRWPE